MLRAAVMLRVTLSLVMHSSEHIRREELFQGALGFQTMLGVAGSWITSKIWMQQLLQIKRYVTAHKMCTHFFISDRHAGL